MFLCVMCLIERNSILIPFPDSDLKQEKKLGLGCSGLKVVITRFQSLIKKTAESCLRFEFDVPKSSVKNPIMASAPSPPYRLTLENLVAKKLSKF